MSSEQIVLDAERKQLWRDRCLSSFRYFTMAFMHQDWYDDDFHGPLCDFIQYGCLGETGVLLWSPDRLVILPRSHLKTTIVTKFYSIWRATREPSIRILIAMNTATNAQSKVAEIKDFFQTNTLYQVLFPDVIPPFSGRMSRWSNESAAVRRPNNYAEGTFDAIGVGGNVVSRHYDLIIEDDTVAPKKDELTGEELMPSRDDIEKAVGWHKLTPPLFVDARTSERIFIATRWAPYDAISYILAKETDSGPDSEEPLRHYIVYDKPALDINGEPNYKRFDKAALAFLERQVGPYMFASLYMNKPIDPANMVFHPGDIQWFKEPKVGGRRMISIDPADPPTGKGDQCYSAIVVTINLPTGLYVEEYFKDRVDDFTLIERAFGLCDKWDCDHIRIEEDRYAHLKLAFDRMNKERFERGRSYIRIEGVKTRGRNKQDRIRSRLQPLAKAGLLWLKTGMTEVEEELLQFPNSKFFDVIDALAWAADDHMELPDYSPEAPSINEHDYAKCSFDELLSSRRQGRTDLPFQVQLGQTGLFERN